MKRTDDERTKRVLARLEERKARRGQAAEPSVVVCPPGTLPDEYARTLDRKTPALYVPSIPEGDDAIERWAAGARRYQSWLSKQGHKIAEGGPMVDAARIREAYKASLDPEASMPD